MKSSLALMQTTTPCWRPKSILQVHPKTQCYKLAPDFTECSPQNHHWLSYYVTLKITSIWRNLYLASSWKPWATIPSVLSIYQYGQPYATQTLWILSGKSLTELIFRIFYPKHTITSQWSRGEPSDLILKPSLEKLHSTQPNPVLETHPPKIDPSEQELPRSTRTRLARC